MGCAPLPPALLGHPLGGEQGTQTGVAREGVGRFVVSGAQGGYIMIKNGRTDGRTSLPRTPMAQRAGGFL